MNEIKCELKNNSSVVSLSFVPKVPRRVNEYVIFSQVVLDIENAHNIGEKKQTALNLAMAKDILSGKLRTYDVSTDFPCAPGKSSPYLRSDQVDEWLKDNGYPHAWSGVGSQAHQKTRPGKGTDKRWSDALIKEYIEYEEQLKAQGCRDYAKKTAEKFNVDPSRARKLKVKYRERKAKISDVSLWKKPEFVREASRAINCEGNFSNKTLYGGISLS